MTELFQATSRVLRDELVSELKSQNIFLRNQIHMQSIPKNIIQGAKVRIAHPPHNFAINITHNTRGIIIDYIDSMALVLFRDNNGNARTYRFYMSNLFIEDPYIDKLLDDLNTQN